MGTFSHAQPPSVSRPTPKTCTEHDGVHMRLDFYRGWFCLLCGRALGHHPERLS
jgi:hypothetical protein